MVPSSARPGRRRGRKPTWFTIKRKSILEKKHAINPFSHRGYADRTHLTYHICHGLCRYPVWKENRLRSWQHQRVKVNTSKHFNLLDIHNNTHLREGVTKSKLTKPGFYNPKQFEKYWFRVKSCIKKSSVEPAMVAQACNPRYLGGEDQKDQSSRPVWAKKFTRLHLNQWLSAALCTCHPSYVEKHK
jgi:hypothetical protein